MSADRSIDRATVIEELRRAMGDYDDAVTQTAAAEAEVTAQRAQWQKAFEPLMSREQEAALEAALLPGVRRGQERLRQAREAERAAQERMTYWSQVLELFEENRPQTAVGRRARDLSDELAALARSGMDGRGVFASSAVKDYRPHWARTEDTRPQAKVQRLTGTGVAEPEIAWQMGGDPHEERARNQAAALRLKGFLEDAWRGAPGPSRGAFAASARDHRPHWARGVEGAAPQPYPFAEWVRLSGWDRLAEGQRLTGGGKTRPEVAWQLGVDPAVERGRLAQRAADAEARWVADLLAPPTPRRRGVFFAESELDERALGLQEEQHRAATKTMLALGVATALLAGYAWWRWPRVDAAGRPL